MRQIYRNIALAMTLILTLAVSAMALAEVADNSQNAELPESVGAESTDSATLEDAFDAYYEARNSERIDDLQSELDGYVASGKLTKEQADLIFNYYKEQQSLSEGICPSCGYKFQQFRDYGRGGKGRGRRDMNGKRGMYGATQSFAADVFVGDSNGISEAVEPQVLGWMENPFAVDYL